MTTYSGTDNGATAVNLSGLPMPAVVETLSFETIVAEMKAELIALLPELEAVLQLESEPIVKLIEIFAYRELNTRQRVNDAAKAVTLAYAVGSDLDHLAAAFGVARLVIVAADPATNTQAVMESDIALRTRVLLAPEGYSVAGPEGAYRFHALGASGDVLDASATSPSPRVVVVTVLNRINNGVATTDLLNLVAAAVSAETRRPLTDQVIVQSAEIFDFNVVATIKTFAGPDSAVVIGVATAQLNTYFWESFRLGRDVTRAGIISALYPNGVQNVDLVSPPADIVVNRLQAARCASITLTHSGLGE